MPAMNGSRTSLSSHSSADHDGDGEPEQHMPLESHRLLAAAMDGAVFTRLASAEFMWRTHSAT